MEPEVLLIDMDGIVADLATEWYARFNKMREEDYLRNPNTYPAPPIPVSIDQITNWDTGKAVGDHRIYGILEQKGLFHAVKPLPGAIRGVQAIKNIKLSDNTPAYDINFLTAAIVTPYALSEKAEWMKEYFPFINPKNIIYAYRKELVKGDIFIDDSPKNLESWKKAWPNGTTIAIDYPYNQNTSVDVRVYDYRYTQIAWSLIVGELQARASMREFIS